PSGIILSGGPESTTEENSPRAPQYVFEAGVPVFGVCYGMQTMDRLSPANVTATLDYLKYEYNQSRKVG
ncbi:hypothetical protein MJI20_30665, partial [Salmonella enterica subsp. enterica serovar Anatum]|nr:hypothetical protein [Salmonella enterica subsp. enterica serovar Anatum]